MIASIPKDVYDKVKDWKVKFAFITKGTNLMSTSKQHKFKQPAILDSAIRFLAESGVKDSTLVFENDSSLIFSAGAYDDLDIFDDDD